MTQIIYSVIGVVFFVAVPRVRHGHQASCSRYTYILGLAGIFLIAFPALLPSQHQRGGRHRREDPGLASAGSPSSRKSSGSCCSPRFFASYLVVNGRKLSLLTEKWWIFSLPRAA